MRKPLKTAPAPYVLFAMLAIVALGASWIAPSNPYDLAQIDILDARLPPGSHGAMTHQLYLLGTDEQGRDLLSAILYGLRISLGVGIAASGLAFLIGGLLGLCAAWFGKRIDSIVMRLADLQLSFPSILIALMLLALTGPGLGKIVMALTAVQWAYFARTMRAVALVERQKDYIESATLLGLTTPRILLRHLLPNCLPPLLALLPLQLAAAISLEATLSFLGLGAPVTEPSLGLLIANGFQYLMSGKYWISFFPGMALMLAILSINLGADRWQQDLSGLQSAADRKQALV